MMNSSELVIRCSCGSEVMVINANDYNSETVSTTLPIDFDIALFKDYSRNKGSLGQRLRHIWRILIHGTPYTDQVCLSKEQAIVLAKWINTHTT